MAPRPRPACPAMVGAGDRPGDPFAIAADQASAAVPCGAYEAAQALARCRGRHPAKRARLRGAGRLSPSAGLARASQAVRLDVGGDGRWLIVLAFLAALELIWWAFCWQAGIAPAPFLGTYLAIGVAGLVAALALRMAVRPGAERASWPALLLGTVLIAIGASLFLPLKYAIPGQIPFWLDPPLAAADRWLLGADAWIVADRWLGWALVPVDHLYALWLPVQTVALFSVMLLAPLPAKTLAMIAYSLAWFVLGVVAAVLFSSAGPIFYDRLL